MTDQVSGRSYRGTAAENYQRFFVPCIGGPVAEDLIEVAHLQPGERVLDVACGTGVVTRLAAERVGATGLIAGLDVNPGMLAVARSETAANISIDGTRQASSRCRFRTRRSMSCSAKWASSLSPTNWARCGRCGGF